MTQMKLVHVPLDQLRVSAQNARQAAPDPDKLKELAASIEAHGLLEPLIVRDGEEGAAVIGGGRRLAAMQLLTCCGARILATSRPGASWADRAIHAALEVAWPALFDPEAVVLQRLSKAQLLEIARSAFPADVLDLRALAGLKKAELVEQIATASAEYGAAKGESPWLPPEMFGE